MARRAIDSVPDILAFVEDADSGVRMAAMAALGKLAGPEHVAGMLKGVLKAEPGPEREAAEKAVMFVCNRTEDVNKRAEPAVGRLCSIGRRQQNESPARAGARRRARGADDCRGGHRRQDSAATRCGHPSALQLAQRNGCPQAARSGTNGRRRDPPDVGAEGVDSRGRPSRRAI